jgi:selenocysteine-specific elongation factor
VAGVDDLGVESGSAASRTAVSSSLVIGTAGHIDHGKSALVKALTGIDPDRLKEEQARGITIDLGFAHTAIDGVNVAFVDVPGHERFVRNMLAGAGGFDAVLLVIAADESVMPQTREHFAICRLLGIERGVIVLSKADLVDRDALEVASLEARELVAGSFLEGAPVLPVSARTGAGLDALRRALVGLAGATGAHAERGSARLPIDRVFSVKGFGTVVTGTLVSGTMTATQDLVVLPEGRPVRVRGMQVHGADVQSAHAPCRAAVNLGAVEVRELARGMTLAAPGSLVSTRRLDVRLELVADARALRHGARVRVHQGTAECLGRVAISAVASAAGRDWTLATVGQPSVEVDAGGRAYARLRLERPVAVTRGDRFVLRAYSPPITIGGGIVLDPAPPTSGLRRPAMLERFHALEVEAEAGPEPSAVPSFVRRWLAESGERGITAQDLIARCGLPPDVSRATRDALVGTGLAIDAAGRLFAVETARAIETRLLDALAAFHRAHPRDGGMPKEALRDRAAPRAAPPLVDAVIAALASRRAVTGTDKLALASHRVVVSADEERVAAKVEAAVRAGGLAPPDAATIASMTRLGSSAVDRALNDLTRDRKLARLDTLWFHVEALAGLKHDIEQWGKASAAARVDVAAFKERFGLSRKFAIPLLEWLDRERVTRRVGDARVILAK